MHHAPPKPLTSCLKNSSSRSQAPAPPPRSRKQQSSIVVRAEDDDEDETTNDASKAANQSPAAVNYWHYKTTGVKSRPIKLLEHPIEHIERKLIYTYLLGILFKLLAVLVGPLVSLCLFLLAAPLVIARRLTWHLLNLRCLCNARIRTSASSSASRTWRYCPLNFLESYWFREKLINHVILVVSHSQGIEFPLDHLRSLIEQNVLSQPRYRKFLCRVVARGVPLYKGYYWLFTGRDKFLGAGEAASEQQDKKSDYETTFELNRHVFIDDSLSGVAAISLKSIRDYTYNLLDSRLDSSRPLWELRAIRAPQKTYLVFRCHQCLADGKSLSRILVEQLTSELELTQTINMIDATCDRAPPATGSPSGEEQAPSAEERAEEDEDVEEDEEDETKLVPLREKRSFITRMGRSSGIKNAIIVGPLTVLLWVVWTFTRRKNNHLNKCAGSGGSTAELTSKLAKHRRRFHMNHYDLTRFHQIKQVTRSTVSDIILCALSGSLREYLRKLNAVSNPPNLSVSLSVDMSSSLEEDASRLVDCSLVSVPLPTSVEGTIPRLWDLRNTMEELRTSLDPWVIIALKRFLFSVLPVGWYQWLVNYITLRNSSVLVSNLRGPINTVESWCQDLMQKAALEAQQPPKIILISGNQQIPSEPLAEPTPKSNQDNNNNYYLHLRGDQRHKVSALYYCLQPPTSNIPISFNCITYRNRLFVTALSRSLLVEDSKILVRLFFRQLDQLIELVAKRRKAFTIISGPNPQDLDLSELGAALGDNYRHQLGGQEVELQASLKRAEEEEEERCDEEVEEIDEGRAKRVVISRYDLEANIEQAACNSCRQPVCTCRRRKSMFSIDYASRQGDMLRRLLMPGRCAGGTEAALANEAHLVGSRTSLESTTNPLPDTCGRLAGSERRAERKRSSLSLGAASKFQHQEAAAAAATPSPGRPLESALTLLGRASRALLSSSSSGAANKTAAAGGRLNYSKSDTNLSPTARADSSGRLFWGPRGGNRSARSPSHLSTRALTGVGGGGGEGAEPMGGSRSPRLISRTGSRVKSVVRLQRRQSIATTSGGASHSHGQTTRLLVKDELNVNVDLRFHLDKAFLARGCQSRRSRKELGGRRSSLIPFGLLPSAANIPCKLLPASNEPETHL